VAIFRRPHDEVVARHPDLAPRRVILEVVRRMIDYVVSDLIEASGRAIAAASPADSEAVRALPAPLLRFSDEVREEHLELKRFLREHLYRNFRVLRMTNKSRRVLRELFEAMMEDIDLMPAEHQDSARRMEAASGRAGRARAVADYVAGMTDRYALLEHRRLFNPAERT
jgi:dGTPase